MIKILQIFCKPYEQIHRRKTTVFVHLHICNFATSEDELYFDVLKTVVFSAFLLRENLAHSKPIRYEAYLRSDWLLYIFILPSFVNERKCHDWSCIRRLVFGVGPTVLFQLPI